MSHTRSGTDLVALASYWHFCAAYPIMAAVEGIRIGGENGPLRKKPKVSELPLSSIKRASIDSLLHVFKKKGEFDALRKKTYKQFEEGVRSKLICYTSRCEVI